jgi:hypothetical protein
MTRTKGSKNSTPPFTVATLNLSLEERIQLIANLIVDTIYAQKQVETVIEEEFSDD